MSFQIQNPLNNIQYIKKTLIQNNTLTDTIILTPQQNKENWFYVEPLTTGSFVSTIQCDISDNIELGNKLYLIIQKKTVGVIIVTTDNSTIQHLNCGGSEDSFRVNESNRVMIKFTFDGVLYQGCSDTE